MGNDTLSGEGDEAEVSACSRGIVGIVVIVILVILVLQFL
jgi:hypothetical protein